MWTVLDRVTARELVDLYPAVKAVLPRAKLRWWRTIMVSSECPPGPAGGGRRDSASAWAPRASTPPPLAPNVLQY